MASMIENDFVINVNNYLDEVWQLNLRTVCKTIYDMIKSNIVYTLNEDYSLGYICNDTVYGMVNSKISQKNLGIVLTRCNLSGLKLDILKNINTIHMKYCKINNMPFNTTINLDLSFSTIIDTKNLGHIKCLNLSNTRITNVKGLENVYDLNVSNTLINNVDNVKSYKLNASFTYVRDVNCLIYTKILLICNTPVTNVDKLNQLEILDASLTNVTKVCHLINLKKLYMVGTMISNEKEFTNMDKLETLDISFTGIKRLDIAKNIEIYGLEK